ncbi:helix-turn-helix domain-containing protein [Bombilactobacillus thymidiniphilus]|uniref:Helix-turn-helix domain-containing protein n=1 Tax=Bombilactobacillus thymidiniphilus TaxID=2923363 RepID=A0ABY4PDS4_9LACO|nr:helix-turn-helix domain-containing protein [Bombilactobacillus thymidiniphilus]UQS83671.1 helix-turn-helix domain-containing protein [Bombilactobacillus thymidiniphilus]
MLTHEDEIKQQIGLIISRGRQHAKISQHDLAEGICSQPMISSIERGTYIPNVVLFMKLCDRLNINLDNSFLKTELNLNSGSDFSNKIFELCKRHKYSEMISYMDEDVVLDNLSTNNDFQTYYYYYGCAIYQLKHDTINAKRYFKTALAFGPSSSSKKSVSEVEVLLLNAIAVVDLELGNIEKSLRYFSSARSNLHLVKNKSENLNVINYQYGLALYKLNKDYDALDVLLPGLNRVILLESYFMLPEYALMIMNCYQRLGNADEAKKYKARYDVYSDMDSKRV